MLFLSHIIGIDFNHELTHSYRFHDQHIFVADLAYKLTRSCNSSEAAAAAAATATPPRAARACVMMVCA